MYLQPNLHHCYCHPRIPLQPLHMRRELMNVPSSLPGVICGEGKMGMGKSSVVF